MPPAITVDLLKRLLDAADILRERMADDEDLYLEQHRGRYDPELRRCSKFVTVLRVELELTSARLTEAADMISVLCRGNIAA
jgi:hypothetical protein